jgi:hypothetical protein
MRKALIEVLLMILVAAAVIGLAMWFLTFADPAPS